MGLRNLTPRVENQSTTSTMGTALNKTPQEVEQEKIQRQQQLGEQARAEGVKGSAMIGGGASATPQQKMQAQPQKAGTGSFTNLKSYLDAAQGKGQQRVAEAATGQVQRLGQSAQKGKEQARSQFGQNLQTGSGAVFQGVEGQTLAEQEAEAARRAREQTQGVISTATGTTYQAPAEGATTQYFTPEEEAQFANVINAQYQGPESLQQVGAYGQASRAATAAQRAAQQTQTAGGRAQLLRDVFGRDREYGRGASRLDAMLLNASEQGVQQLQEQAQPALQARELLQAAQNVSANEAAQRAGAIEGIRTGAMTDFINARQAQEDEANAYISNIQENWNALPDYFKNLLRTTATATVGRQGDINIANRDPYYMNPNFDIDVSPSIKGTTYNLSPEEAAILGLTPGQGMFGVNADSIRASQKATGAELITKDQLSRQLALARLAGLDKSQALNKNLLYTDLEKAGTKDIFSSLDTDSMRRTQEEKRKEMEDAVSRLGSKIIMAYPGPRYNFVPIDVLQRGGYQMLANEGLAAENRSQELLKRISEGENPLDSISFAPKYLNPQPGEKNYIQKAFERIMSDPGTSYNIPQMLRWGLAPLASEMSKYGAFDTVQTANTSVSRQRADELRNLLSRLTGKK